MITHDRAIPEPPERVVVLGASGFVGSALTRNLVDQGMSVVPVSSSDIDLTQPDSLDALRKTVGAGDAVVLVSAITPDKGRDIRTLMRNLSMVEHVCAFLKSAQCSHFVYISSDAVYDDDANPVREDSCCDPASYHGLMHLVRERMLAETLSGSETPLLVLRPSLLYGPNDTHNSYGPNRFLRMVQSEQKITLFGNGEEKRDHVLVTDVAAITSLCLMHRSSGILNVATGEARSFYDVAQTIAGLSEDAVEIECLPRQQPITHRHFDISATLKALPTFRYTPLPAGIADTFKGTSVTDQ